MRIFILFIISLCIATVSYANMAVVKTLPEASKISTYSYSYFLWDVYDIALYADTDQISRKSDLALALTYKRDLKGQDISRHSIDEIQNLGFKDKKILKKWQSQMDTLFPDVQEGIMLTGIRKDNTAIFYRNETYLGTIKDALFARYFFDIWLSPSTSEPDMRNALLGQK